MLSPRHTLGFTSNQDIFDFEGTQPSSVQTTSKISGNHRKAPIVINPLLINFANQTSRKDKRLTMAPENIKKYITE
jgi:hypothetical protein